MESLKKAEDIAQQESDDLARVLEQAEKGDCSVLAELRRLLDANPDVWRNYGDLGAQAEAAFVRLAAGSTNLLMEESLLRKVEELKRELNGEAPSPLERLLVDRVCVTWLDTAYHDALYAQTTTASDAQRKTLERQRAGAHQRHLGALKQLATVRKLLTPAHSPVEIATRLGGKNMGGRSSREGIAGTLVPTTN